MPAKTQKCAFSLTQTFVASLVDDGTGDRDLKEREMEEERNKKNRRRTDLPQGENKSSTNRLPQWEDKAGLGLFGR